MFLFGRVSWDMCSLGYASLAWDMHVSLGICIRVSWDMYRYLSLGICSMYVSLGICTCLLGYVRVSWDMYVSLGICTRLLGYVSFAWDNVFLGICDLDVIFASIF